MISNKLKKYALVFIKFLLPLILLCILLAQTDIQNIGRVFMSLKPHLLVAAYSCFILNILAASLRIRLMANSNASFLNFFHIQCLGIFWTNISPGKLGEISFPILWSKRANISAKQSISLLILTRSIDYVLLLLSYVVGLYFIWDKIDEGTRKYAAIFLIVSPLLLLISGTLYFFLIKHFISIPEILKKVKDVGLTITVLSVLIIGLRYLALYFFVSSFGNHIAILNLILMSFFLFLSKFIQTFAGLGTYEMAITGALMVFGFNKSDAINLSFNVHLLQLAIIITIGLTAYLVDLKNQRGQTLCLKH